MVVAVVVMAATACEVVDFEGFASGAASQSKPWPDLCLMSLQGCMLP